MGDSRMASDSVLYKVADVTAAKRAVLHGATLPPAGVGAQCCGLTGTAAFVELPESEEG